MSRKRKRWLTSERARYYEVSQLRRHGDIDALLRALRDPTVQSSMLTVRGLAASELAKAGVEEAGPPIIDLLKDENHWVRMDAAIALGRLREPSAVGALIEALADDRLSVRRWAAGSLGKIGDPRAVPALSELL